VGFDAKIKMEFILMDKKYKKIIYSCIVSFLLVLIFILPVGAKNNIALECNIDSSCGEQWGDKSAGSLVDRDENYDTKWHASDGEKHPGEPHWIILDFGSEKTFDLIRLVKASHGTDDFGKTEFNASGFVFEISSDKKSWAVILDVEDDGDMDIYEGSFIPATARYLKLIVTQPERDDKSNENQAVRLYDLKVFEYESEEEYIDETENYNDPDEVVEIESPEVPLANIPAPKTSDSLMLSVFYLVLLFLSGLIIYRIGYRGHKRHFGG